MPIRPQAATATAADSSHFHVLSLGSTGANVKALQYLLRFNGLRPARQVPHDAFSVDGLFGSITKNFVKGYQQSRRTGSGGVVKASTWRSLTSFPVVRYRATGDHVRAITTLLDKFDGRGVSSGFWTTTRWRVREFQKNAGISVDGAVGPNTWRNLVFQYEQPDPNGVGLCLGTIKGEDTNDYATDSWGTASTVSFLERTASKWVGRYKRVQDPDYPIPLVAFRDISLERGGSMGRQHSTHRTGMDIDLRPMSRTNAHCTSGLTFTSSRYDKRRTLRLIKDFMAASSRFGGNLYKETLFNDPWIIGQFKNDEVVWSRGHHNHLHVTFCTPGHPVGTYRC